MHNTRHSSVANVIYERERAAQVEPFSRRPSREAAAWCREGDLNPHSPFGPADFKSAASANFAIPAGGCRAQLLKPEVVSHSGRSSTNFGILHPSHTIAQC